MLVSHPPAEYRVVSGDCLYSIAQKIWGNPNLWHALYRDNEQTVGTNPNYIIPGEVLNVPSHPSAVTTLSDDVPDVGSHSAGYQAKHAAPVSGGALSGTLNCPQLESLWDANGGNPAHAFIAAEVAEAESAGEQYATDNDSDGTQDRGYWQINSTHGPILSTYNADGNARAAIIISYDGTNWSAWTTYVTGAFQGRC